MACPYTTYADGGLSHTLHIQPVIPGGALAGQIIANTAVRVVDSLDLFLNHPLDALRSCLGVFCTHILSGPIVIQILAVCFLCYSCYQAYCSWSEVVQSHLDAGKGGTSADAWGWWILWRLGLMGGIPNVYDIEFSPFLKPHRGILHASDIPKQQGSRSVVIGIAPQRQKTQKTSVSQFEIVQNRLRQKSIDYPHDLVFERSFLEKLCGTWALKVKRQDRSATSNTTVLSTANPYTSRRERAWIKRFGYEIAHAHHADGSMHAFLHPEDGRTVIEQGWGERHPLASTTWHWMFYWDNVKSLWDPASRPPVPETFVFLYAPRNSKEVDFMFCIVDAAIWYSTGEEVDSNVGKGTRRMDRYLDKHDSAGNLRSRGKVDTGCPATHLIPSTAGQARTDEKIAIQNAQSSATRAKGSSSSSDRPIPVGIRSGERSVYDKLSAVRKQREGDGQSAPKIVVITDLAKDYDDLTAMIVLKELHRMGVITILGFVANLKPARKRAIYGRAALDSLDLPDVPIAIGTDGIGPPPPGAAVDKKAYEEHDYEFTASFYTDRERKSPSLGEGSELLKDICTKAKARDEKITFLLLSSLQDISDFSSENEELFKAVVENVVMQGGYEVDPFRPSDKAANNKFHWPAAEKFHLLIAPVQSTVYTKHAAHETALSPELLTELARTGHVLGKHLEKVYTEQEKEFYKNSCGTGFWMTHEDYLKLRTNWYDTHNENQQKPDPKNGEIVQYLTKVIVYDALAAMGAAGQDVLAALDIKPRSMELHEIVGRPKPGGGNLPDINPEKMIETLSALLRGSLLASQQELTASD